jgi:hypothetical protein
MDGRLLANDVTVVSTQANAASGSAIVATNQASLKLTRVKVVSPVIDGMNLTGCATATIADIDISAAGSVGIDVNQCSAIQATRLHVAGSMAEGVLVRANGTLRVDDALLEKNGGQVAGNLHISDALGTEIDCRCNSPGASTIATRMTLLEGAIYGVEADIRSSLSIRDALIKNNRVGAILRDQNFAIGNLLDHVTWQSNQMAICLGTEVACGP